MVSMKTFLSFSSFLAVISPWGVSATVVAKKKPCKRHVSDVAVISARSATADGMVATFDAFKVLLGGEDNGSSPAQPSGHRSINWDAPANILPFDMPGDFFAKIVPRGLSIASSNAELRVSNDGIDDKFDTINPDASANFIQFSSPRLFTPLNDNVIQITFSPPGGTGPATVTGFGAVFVDVDITHATKLIALDSQGCILYEGYVEPSPGGLSFLGVKFEQPLVAKITIKLGIDQKGKGGKGGKPKQKMGMMMGGGGGYRKRDLLKNTVCKGCDAVVLDDFLYGEPQALY